MHYGQIRIKVTEFFKFGNESLLKGRNKKGCINDIYAALKKSNGWNLLFCKHFGVPGMKICCLLIFLGNS